MIRQDRSPAGRMIGEGTYGKVYARGGSRPVAVKVEVNEDLSSSWLTEVATMAQLKHPNIVRVVTYDLFHHRNGSYVHRLTMELGECDLTRASPHPDEKPGLYQDLLRAVAHIHSLGILHRDIKPENIIVFRSGDRLTAKLSDFGAAIVMPGTSILHRREVVTSWWRPPEMWEPFVLESYGAEIDVYSVLAVGLWLLFGIKPDGIRWSALRADRPKVGRPRASPTARAILMATRGFALASAYPVVDSVRTFLDSSGLPAEDPRYPQAKYLSLAITCLPGERPTIQEIGRELWGLDLPAPRATEVTDRTTSAATLATRAALESKGYSRAECKTLAEGLWLPWIYRPSYGSSDSSDSDDPGDSDEETSSSEEDWLPAEKVIKMVRSVGGNLAGLSSS